MNWPEAKRLFTKTHPIWGIGVEVMNARHRKGLTQAQLAKQTGTYQSAIARLENGHQMPSITFLLKIADALNMDLEIELINKERVLDA